MCFTQGLVSVVFGPRVPPAFIVWALGKMRNRTNWEVTTLQHSRNILCMITALALDRRDFTSVSKRVFEGCLALKNTEDLQNT